MESKKAAFALILFLFLVKLGVVFFLPKLFTPHPYVDLKYYVFYTAQAFSGHFGEPSAIAARYQPPFIFAFFAFFKILGLSTFHAIGVGDAIISTLLFIPLFKIVEIYTDAEKALFACVLWASSYAHFHFFVESFKNEMALFFALYAILALVVYSKTNKRMHILWCGVFLTAVAFTHYTTALWVFIPTVLFSFFGLLSFKLEFVILLAVVAILSCYIIMMDIYMPSTGKSILDNAGGFFKGSGYSKADARLILILLVFLAMFIPFVGAGVEVITKQSLDIGLLFLLWLGTSLILSVPLFVSSDFGYRRFVQMSMLPVFILASIGFAKIAPKWLLWALVLANVGFVVFDQFAVWVVSELWRKMCQA